MVNVSCLDLARAGLAAVGGWEVRLRCVCGWLLVLLAQPKGSTRGAGVVQLFGVCGLARLEGGAEAVPSMGGMVAR